MQLGSSPSRSSARGIPRTPCSTRSAWVPARSDPTGFELEFTTENSDGVTQRVLPTFTTIVGQGGGAVSLGDYDPAMLVHGEQSIRLHGELPAAGTVSTTTRVAGMYDKGAAGLVVLESESRYVGGEPAFTSSSSLFIRGVGGFGGPRNPEGDEESTLAAEPLPTREPDEVVSYATRSDQALLYRLSGDRNPLHSDPVFAKRGGLRPPDPARVVHVRLHRARPAPRRVRLGPGAFRLHAGPLLQADHARRHADRLPVGRRRRREGRLPVPHRRRSAARPSWTPGCSGWPAEPAARASPASGAHAEHVEAVALWLEALGRGQLVHGHGHLSLNAALGVTSVTLPHRTHRRWWWCSVRSSASSKRANSSLAATRRTRPAVCRSVRWR